MHSVKAHILILLILASCVKPDSDAELKNINHIMVRVSPILQSKNIRKLSFGGRVSSRNQSEEVSLIQGKISRVFVRAGEKVEKGQALASINPVTKGLSYNQYKVRSSTAGVVLTSQKQSGSLVSENEVLFTIGNGFEYQVDVWGSIDDILNIPKSKIVNIGLAPASKYKMDIRGTLFSVSSIPDSKSGLYKIRVIYSCEKDEKLFCNVLSRNSVWARVDFTTEEGSQLVLKGKFIPSWSKHLFILQKDNTVKKVEVKVGPAVVDGTSIISGVSEGDRVVVSYNRRPSDGEKVELVSKNSGETKE